MLAVIPVIIPSKLPWYPTGIHLSAEAFHKNVISTRATSGLHTTAKLTSRPKHCSKQKVHQLHQRDNYSTMCQIIICVCLTTKYKPQIFVTIQIVQLSFGRCPRTSLCQNKWILFKNSQFMDERNVEKNLRTLKRHKCDNPCVNNQIIDGTWPKK